MALVHKTSDIVSFRIDKDNQNNDVIEIEFRFIRYRLVIDDEQQARQLLALLKELLKPKLKEATNVKLPPFYKNTTTGGTR